MRVPWTERRSNQSILREINVDARDLRDSRASETSVDLPALVLNLWVGKPWSPAVSVPSAMTQSHQSLSFLPLHFFTLSGQSLIQKPQLYNIWASLVAQTIKNLPAIQETQVQSLVLENHLEKEKAMHSIVSPTAPLPLPPG